MKPARWNQSDRAVQDTNVDAQISKLSAAKIGYLHDEFVQFFVRKPQRRPPIINRGYYARDHILNQLLNLFLKTNLDQPKQILSLGAGFDTRFFQLQAQGFPCSVQYFEVDFAAVIAAKIEIIRSKEILTKSLASLKIDVEKNELCSDSLTIISGDLRQFDAIEKDLIDHGFQKDLPTFILSECVLIYLKKEDADHVVEWASSFLNRVFFVCYEQIHPNDAFGETMIRNLENRGIVLKSISAYPDLKSQQQRYLDRGFDHVISRDMLDLYNQHIPAAEKQRISRLEFLDEIEEWNLIMQHYCCTWASKNLGQIDLPNHSIPPDVED